MLILILFTHNIFLHNIRKVVSFFKTNSDIQIFIVFLPIEAYPKWTDMEVCQSFKAMQASMQFFSKCAMNTWQILKGIFLQDFPREEVAWMSWRKQSERPIYNIHQTFVTNFYVIINILGWLLNFWFFEDIPTFLQILESLPPFTELNDVLLVCNARAVFGTQIISVRKISDYTACCRCSYISVRKSLLVWKLLQLVIPEQWTLLARKVIAFSFSYERPRFSQKIDFPHN